MYKTKCNSNGNVKRYKARLVAKSFTQKDDVNYKETFSPVSKNDSFRIITALVAYYDLASHQIHVKFVFLNGNLEKDVYTTQPEGFSAEG